MKIFIETERLFLREILPTGSHKVLIKVGLKFIETFVHQGIKHNWYTIDRKEFESKTPIGNN